MGQTACYLSFLQLMNVGLDGGWHNLGFVYFGVSKTKGRKKDEKPLKNITALRWRIIKSSLTEKRVHQSVSQDQPNKR